MQEPTTPHLNTSFTGSFANYPTGAFATSLPKEDAFLFSEGANDSMTRANSAPVGGEQQHRRSPKLTPMLKPAFEEPHVGRMLGRNIKTNWTAPVQNVDGKAKIPTDIDDDELVLPEAVTSPPVGAVNQPDYTPPTSNIPEGGPTARFGHTAVVSSCCNCKCFSGSESSMVVFGGRDSSSYSNDIWTYRFAGNVWSKIPSCCEAGNVTTNAGGSSSTEQQAPKPRAGHTAIVTEENKMIIFGGGVDATHCLNDVWELDMKTMKWKLLKPEACPYGAEQHPVPRKGHTAVEYEKTMIVYGGDGEDTSVWVFRADGQGTNQAPFTKPHDPQGVSAPSSTSSSTTEEEPCCPSWIQAQCCGKVPISRQYHAAEIDHEHNTMLVFGGRSKRGFLNDLHELDLNSLVWREIHASGDVPSARMCASSCFQNGMLCIFNGGSNRYYADCYEYDRETSSWRRLSAGPIACTRPTTVVHNNKITMFGGCGPGNKFLNNVVELKLKAPTLVDCCREWLLSSTDAATCLAGRQLPPRLSAILRSRSVTPE